MSELIQNKDQRKGLLKHMIRQLHEGEAPEQVKEQLKRILGQVPYGEVVEVEQELMAEGMPREEILKLCDVHTEVLRGAITGPAESVIPDGHPMGVFQQENNALGYEAEKLGELFAELGEQHDEDQAGDLFASIRSHFYLLMDVEKHYQRKENLLFPFLEKHGITGPSTVMWGKHDETREWLKAGSAALEGLCEDLTVADLKAIVEMALRPATAGVQDMIMKEEEILFPMSLENLTESEWISIHMQSPDYGYCIVEPDAEWQFDESLMEPAYKSTDSSVRFPTGTMTPGELQAILSTIPFDMTFVGADDKVRYFTEGRERIFARSRAIIGRNVQHCHPPKSVDTVARILRDFKSGEQDHAAFWIEMGGRFIHIEYYALRNPEGTYLGTLEVSQDLTAKRALTGQRRLLEYDNPERPS